MKPMDYERFVAPRTVEVVEGATIEAAVRRSLADPVLEHYAVVELDGAPVDRSLWTAIQLKAGSVLRVALRPRGKTGKKILKTVLLIAVVVVAAWISGGGLGAGFAAGMFKANLAAAAFTAVASLAVNALIPPPGLGNNPTTEVDPTYSLSGTRNQARPDAPIPVVFGSHRYTPDLITEQYQEVVGDDIWLRFGVCWGVGSYEVEDLRIGETPISEFEGITVQHQLTPTAEPTTLIRSDFTQDAVGATLDTDWTTRRTAGDAADAEILLQFPRGLGTQDEKGKPKAVSVRVEVRVRVVTDEDEVGDWSDIGTDNPIIADGVAETLGVGRRDRVFDDLVGTPTAIYDQYTAGLMAAGVGTLSRTFNRSDVKPFSASIPIALPPGQRFDISVRRTTLENDDLAVLDEVSWAQLNTFQTSAVVNDARLATSFFRIKASDQLSGFVDELNGLVHRLAPTYTGPEDSGLAVVDDWGGPLVRTTNNADIILDVMRGAHTAAPTPLAEIHWPDLAAFWIWCRDNEFSFSLPIGGGQSRGEVLDMVARAGRARLFRHNGLVRIAIDRPRLEGPTQIITPRNGRNFSFQRSFASPVHALRLRFVNADADFTEDEILIYAPGHTAETATLIEDVDAPGMLSADLVHGYGSYLMAQMLDRVLTASCEMDIEVGTLKLGDYIRLVHPVLDEAALAAKVLSSAEISGGVIQVDLDTEFDPDPLASYIVRHRRIVVAGGEAGLECSGLYPIDNPGEPGRQITLSDPLPEGVTIADDDLMVIGLAGQDSFEGLVREIEPSGPRAAQVELVAYLPDTLINPPAVDHVPTGRLPFRPVPTPILVGVSLTESDVSVAFQMRDSAAGRIARFETRSRVLPDTEAGETGAWSRLPDLPADARTVSTAIAAPDQIIEIEITAIDQDGRRSAALRVESDDAAPIIPAPANPILTPGTTGGLSGSLVPVLDVVVDPVDTTRLASLVVESRSSGTDDDWTIVATASSAQARARVLGLPPGALLDVRLAWQSPRGVLTPEDARPVVTEVQIPDSLVATGVGGLSGDDIRDQLIGETAEAVAELANRQLDADGVLANVWDRITNANAVDVERYNAAYPTGFGEGATGILSDNVTATDVALPDGMSMGTIVKADGSPASVLSSPQERHDGAAISADLRRLSRALQKATT